MLSCTQPYISPAANGGVSRFLLWFIIVLLWLMVKDCQSAGRQTKVPRGVLEARSSTENPLTWSGKISGNESAPQKELYSQGQVKQVDARPCPLAQNKTPLKCSLPLHWHHITHTHTHGPNRRRVWKRCKNAAKQNQSKGGLEKWDNWQLWLLKGRFRRHTKARLRPLFLPRQCKGKRESSCTCACRSQSQSRGGEMGLEMSSTLLTKPRNTVFRAQVQWFGYRSRSPWS